MSFIKNSLITSLGTLLSRLSGLIREIVMANVFGASVLLDAFFVAFRIPNLFRDMLAEGALGSSFTKVFSQISEKSYEQSKLLAWNILSFTLCLTSILVSMGIFFRHYLVKAMTSFSMGKKTLMIDQAQVLTAILLPLLALTSCSALVAGVLCYRKKFYHNSISPVLFNLGCIIGMLALGPVLHSHNIWLFNSEPMITGLAVGALAGGLIQLLWLIYPVLTTFIPKKITFNWNNPHLIATFKEGLPMMIAASVTQINVLINTNFATSLEDGAVSWLNFAFRPLQLPVGLFAVATATVALPALSVKLGQFKNHHQLPNLKHLNQNELKIYRKNGIDVHIKWVMWIMAFCMAMLFFGSYEIITALFYGGQFDQLDTIMTHRALQAYSIGVIGYGINKILFAYYYATGKTGYGLRVAIICLLISVGANLMLISSYGHVGLAAVSGFIMLLQAGLLYYKVNPLFTNKSYMLFELCGSILAIVICGIVIYFLTLWFWHIPDLNNQQQLFIFDQLMDGLTDKLSAWCSFVIAKKLAGLVILTVKAGVCLIVFGLVFYAKNMLGYKLKLIG